MFLKGLLFAFLILASKPLNMELMELDDGIQIAITGSFKSAKVFKFGSYLVVDVENGKPSSKLPRKANFCGAQITVEDLRRDFGVVRFSIKPPSSFSYTYRQVSNAVIVKLKFKKQKIKQVVEPKTAQQRKTSGTRVESKPKSQKTSSRATEQRVKTAQQRSKPPSKPTQRRSVAQQQQPKRVTSTAKPKKSTKTEKLSVSVYGARLELLNIALRLATGDTSLIVEGPSRVFINEQEITVDSLKKLLQKPQE